MSSGARFRRSASKEITLLLVIDPYNEFISAGPPSIATGPAGSGPRRPLSSLAPESSAIRKLEAWGPTGRNIGTETWGQGTSRQTQSSHCGNRATAPTSSAAGLLSPVDSYHCRLPLCRRLTHTLSKVEGGALRRNALGFAAPTSFTFWPAAARNVAFVAQRSANFWVCGDRP